MIIARTKVELKDTLKNLSNKPGKLALIPTMGNLHDGHLSLIKLAKLKSSKTITTIFVNPLQFSKNEDFNKYPKTHELDIEKLEKEQCDVLFMPINKDEVFPAPSDLKHVDSGVLGKELCGKIRPGHFNGVLTVVNRIFELINPDLAVFGAKDYQQQILIKKMAHSLYPNLELVTAPIIRSKSGLALSSRNTYLSSEELTLASNLFKSLQQSVISYNNKIRTDEIINEAQKFLKSKKLIFDYFELRDSQLNTVKDNNFIGKKVFLGSVTINKTRLIDNIEF
ncbi:pantoate--beta-alanine ligase [Alphaproteobacteria bacterium]|nr:pantoate--beta-alanine ligase [Alphaproteobacteria bacterium]